MTADWRGKRFEDELKVSDRNVEIILESLNLSKIFKLTAPRQLQPIAELLHLLHHFHTVGFIVSKVIPVLRVRRDEEIENVT